MGPNLVSDEISCIAILSLNIGSYASQSLRSPLASEIWTEL
ncbi:hypothetical protein EV13_2332 [Prochlorococcus sp. MIT 0702]|nr:hypothetical protein EV13_2332 [Prochlorococcus sp. MIT 0702]